VNNRTQLTLFVPLEQAVVIESLRQILDPVQFSLIAAHVTFAREDELAAVDSDLLEKRLEGIRGENLSLTFGEPQSFGGHGVLLPCIAGEHEFQALRRHVLGTSALGGQHPHITLAHPRNPLAPGNNPGRLATLGHPIVARFKSICRIRQEAGAPWQVLAEYSLRGHAPSAA
jgi:2'-5' RNA ligase